MLRLLTFQLLALLLASTVAAQHPHYRQLTTDNGLPSNTVYDLELDGRGFLWLATELGTYRYSGYEFEHVRHASEKSRGTTRLRLAPDGSMYWINFRSGLFFHQEGNVRQVPLDVSLGPVQLYNFCFDTEGKCWAGGRLGLYMYNPAADTATFFKQFAAGHVGVVWPGRAGEVYCQSPLGFFRVTVSDTSPIAYPSVLDRVELGNKRKSLPAEDFAEVNQAQGGSLLCVPKKQLLLQENDSMRFSGTVLNHLPDSAKVIRVADLGAAGLWALTYIGAIELHSGKHLFPGVAVSDMVQDHEGLIWVSTLNNGLLVVPNLHIELYNSSNSGLPDQRVTALASDDAGRIYAGLGNGAVYRLPTANQPAATYRLPGEKEIHALAPVTELQKVLAGSSELGIFGMETSELEKVAQVSGAKSVINFQGVLLMATSNGLWQLASDTWQLERNTTLSAAQTRLRALPALKLLVDQSDTVVWLCGPDSLQRGSAPQGQPKQLRFKAVKATFFDSLQHLSVSSICQDAKGRVWLGTGTNGVVVLQNGQTFAHYHTGNGLYSNYCAALATQGDYVWIGCELGVQRLHIPTGEIVLINRTDGLPENIANDLLVLRDTLWLATTKGLVRMPAAVEAHNNVPPPIWLKSVLVNGKPLDMQAQQRLQYEQRNVVFALAGLNYRSQGGLQYRYRLLGLDSTWRSQPGSNPVVRFSSLPAGSYQFEAVAVNEDGVPSAQAIQQTFTVLPAWWETLWFRALVALLLVLAVSGVFLLRIRAIQRKSALERDLRASELTALKAQMNPHFLFNALNSVQEFVLLNDKRQANAFLGKFANLIRKTLHSSQKSTISLEEELELLRLYLELEAFRFEDSFAYQLEVAPAVDTTAVELPALLVQPYVENAIKHGLLHRKHNRKLHVHFELDASGEALLTTIEDNGIGRTASAAINARRPHQHESFATSATAKRLQLLNKERKRHIALQIEDLVDAHGQATGTRVTLQIPIDDPSLKA